jgi:hypothetical protein
LTDSYAKLFFNGLEIPTADIKISSTGCIDHARDASSRIEEAILRRLDRFDSKATEFSGDIDWGSDSHTYSTESGDTDRGDSIAYLLQVFKSMKPTRTLQCAYHEAGHAVLAHIYGAKVLSVEIFGPEEARTLFEVPNGDPLDVASTTAIIACAGLASEYIFGLRSIVDCGLAMCDPNFPDTQLMAWLCPTKRGTLFSKVVAGLSADFEKAAIERVANALLKADLTGDEFRALVGELPVDKS